MNLHAEGKPHFCQEFYFATTSQFKKMRGGTYALELFAVSRECAGGTYESNRITGTASITSRNSGPVVICSSQPYGTRPEGNRRT